MTRELVDPEAFINAQPERLKEDVPVPELGNGACIPVWGLTVTERTRMERQNAKDPDNARRRVLEQCCRNDDGTPFFTREQANQLCLKSAAHIERLVDKGLELSGMLGNADLEATVKN